MKKPDLWNKHFAKLVIGSSLMLGAQLAYAADEHLHTGDIEIEVEAGKLHTHGAAENQAGTGYAIFESDFRDLAGGPYKTDDPGYDSVDGTFAVGAVINYNAIGNLWFWDGMTWSSTVANNEKIRLDGNLGEETIWTSTGTSGDLTGLVGQAGSDGKIHEHLDMRVIAPTGFLPTTGAYYITMYLSGTGLENSDPYLIVFNNGLAEEDFEASVAALAAIPEPESYVLMLAGLAFIGMRRRQKR